jgi:hypothetical protein
MIKLIPKGLKFGAAKIHEKVGSEQFAVLSFAGQILFRG